MQVILRHIGKDPWAGIVKYKNCFSTIASYYTRSGSRYTGLTDDEARRFEKLLGHPEGYLDRSSPFWINFSFKIGAGDTILDTDIPFEEMLYLFFSRDHKDIANGTSKIKPGNKYVLINKESEAVEHNTFSRIKRKAISEFEKLSLEDMRKCLRLFGYKADTMTADLVEQKLYDYVEHDPNRFLDKWVNNKTRNTEALIATAISKNILRKNKNVYYYGTDIIGNSMEDTVAFFEDKNNQDIKLSILNELEFK